MIDGNGSVKIDNGNGIPMAVYAGNEGIGNATATGNDYAIGVFSECH